MNHLAHLALAGDEPALLVGAFLGDFIKGRLESRFPPDIERGIRLHRAIDAFTDSHPNVRESSKRFEPPYRRYSGIILDVVFDFLLAKSWSTYYDTDLEAYSHSVLSTLIEHSQHLPAQAETMARRMHEANSLAAHGEERFLRYSLTRLSSRLSRDNPLDTAYEYCTNRLDHLDADFHEFYPLLQDFCDEWKQQHPSGTINL
ncbi:MAG: DUF479 domain-containing protein [Gammaproteobacteria bacterium]|jgi:acyl carrier protein phosphodiesterase|nr:DUF479 domain-containing protein [Gammaproteobacteria bacterium]MBT4493097.1 DUF479 domain-containing protein [Gammaproteobacteria bacterium]MBT7372215.1 DUF479 domain-containing protein [Gammaproteobacteria bacterium]